MPRRKPHPESAFALSASFEPWDLVPVEDGDFDEQYPYRVVIHWGEVEGRWEPADITVRTVRLDLTGPITGSTLRAIAVGRFVDTARAAQADLAAKVTWTGTVPDGLVEAWEKGEKPRLGVEHYQQVADVYKAAFAAGASPTKVVAETFDQNYSTAASWVSRARKHGLLGPAVMGKKGI